MIGKRDVAPRAAMGEQPADAAKRVAKLMAMHHHVDHAVLEKIFGALEAVGKLLADGLLDDARPGEADQRAGLGDMDVAEHGVRRGHAAGGRMGQHHDVRKLRLAELLHGDGGARHLHQRQNALLHARAAGSGKQNERARRFTAVRMPEITASPAAVPSEPPRKSKSCTAATIFSP